MEAMSAFLGGLGALGIMAAILMALVVFLFLPWWAIVDCVRSRRGDGGKVVLVVLLVLTWSVGSLFYGLFFASSRVLRAFTAVALVAFVAILVPSVASFITGASVGSSLYEENLRRETEELMARFDPALVPVDALEPFHAVHFTHASPAPRAATLARFTLAGPEPATGRDIDTGVRHIAHDRDNDRYFALTKHDFGTITPSSGRFTGIEVDPSLGDFGWPKGIAFDAENHRVIVMTSHVSTRFYAYDPRTSDWERLPSEIRDLPLVGLAYSPDDRCLYALEHDGRAPVIERVHRFNTNGASLGAIALDLSIPVGRHRPEFVQLHASSGRLVVVLAPLSEKATENRLVVVDPATGTVAVPDSLAPQIESASAEPNHRVDG